MADTIYAGPVEDIDALIALCQFPPEAYVLVEQVPRHVVVRAEERQNLLLFTRLGELDKGMRLSDYTSGRVFTPDCELRWQRKDGQGNQFQGVYIGPEREQLPLKKDEEQSKVLGDCRDTNYLLFGERLDEDDISKIGPPAQEGDFAQLRIPRLLRYPKLPEGWRARRLQVVVGEYTDEITGNVRLFRFRDLQEVPAGEK